MYHDYQSLVFLTWVLATLVHIDTSRFSKITQYVWLPLMCLCYMNYYVISMFGVINFEGIARSHNKLMWYNYGFYPFEVPLLDFMLMYATLFSVTVFVRLAGRKDYER
jgi:hypothetical protein